MTRDNLDNRARRDKPDRRAFDVPARDHEEAAAATLAAMSVRRDREILDQIAQRALMVAGYAEAIQIAHGLFDRRMLLHAAEELLAHAREIAVLRKAAMSKGGDAPKP